ncbi:MAG: hypothetical protein HY457_03675 [Parcubacteria group bacterium]|nr:hypothetical protein [Parcubacteria group bacterium]
MTELSKERMGEIALLALMAAFREDVAAMPLREDAIRRLVSDMAEDLGLGKEEVAVFMRQICMELVGEAFDLDYSVDPEDSSLAEEDTAGLEDRVRNAIEELGSVVQERFPRLLSAALTRMGVKVSQEEGPHGEVGMEVIDGLDSDDGPDHGPDCLVCHPTADDLSGDTSISENPDRLVERPDAPQSFDQPVSNPNNEDGRPIP